MPREADAKSLKKACRELARRYHPDTSTQPDAEQRFREIAEAYEVLSDPARRVSYDAHGFAGLSGLVEPLGMSRTGFVHARAPADIATGSWRLPPGGQAVLRVLLPPGIVGRRTDGLVAFRPFYVNGPPYGGLVGDVQDAARFLSLHLGEGAFGGRRLLSAESAVAMRTLTTKGTKLTTGLGWWRRHEADSTSDLVEHLGGGGAYRNLMRLYPRSGRAVVMFGNLTSYPVEHLTTAVLGSPPGVARALAGSDG